MRNSLKSRWQRLTLEQQFLLAGSIVLLSLMLTIGAWVNREIETHAVQHTGSITAIYVNSFVTPLVQELAHREELTAGNMAELDRLLTETPLGEAIVGLKIWSPEGRILYATDPNALGRIYPMTERLSLAWQGTVNTEISGLDEEEHGAEADAADRLMETYSPVHLSGSGRTIAVAEFYQTIDSLEDAGAAIRTRTWLLVGFTTLVGFGLLVALVRRGSKTIAHQQGELSRERALIAEASARNENLKQRVRRAAARTTSVNERFLRRISAELHDGPAQSLGLALLRLDKVSEQTAVCSCDSPAPKQMNDDLSIIQDSVHSALDEIRQLAAGMSLPELEDLSLADTISRAVRTHERRTGSPVETAFGRGLGDSPLALKITVYRFVQEALQNAHHHANGALQQVQVTHDDHHLRVAVSDDGPGFESATTNSGAERDEHLGLIGMRERVESMGGTFWVDSKADSGTTVGARLPDQTGYRDDE